MAYLEETNGLANSNLLEQLDSLLNLCFLNIASAELASLLATSYSFILISSFLLLLTSLPFLFTFDKERKME